MHDWQDTKTRFAIALLQGTPHEVVHTSELTKLKADARGFAVNPLLKDNDKLDEMWAVQSATYDNNGMPHIGFDSTLGKRQRELFNEGIKQYVLCTVAEAVEMLNWTSWKHWSVQLGNKSSVEPFSNEHIEEMREEVVDQFAFVLSQAMVLGMTPMTLFDKFVHKIGTVVKARASDSKY